MNNTIFYLLFLLISIEAYSQKISKETFNYNAKSFEYYVCESNSNTASFTVIICYKTSENKDWVKKIKKCQNKNNAIGTVYVLLLPMKIDNEESFTLDFICDILSKRSLMDFDMNLISSSNFFTSYEDFRKKNGPKYKNCFLNKITKHHALSKDDEICDLLQNM